MDRLVSITVFGQVVDCGGFSAAGRRLNMSVTMVSNHVQALENHLGARLLNRTTRKVSLTEIGKTYYERSSQILNDLKEADRLASALQATPRGTLRIYTSTHIMKFLAPVLSEFMATYVDIALDLTIGERIVDLVAEGYDLAIRTIPPPDSSMIVRRLTPWRHILCCAPQYLVNHAPPRHPSDLAGHNCLQYAFYPFGDEWRFEDIGAKAISVRVKGNVISNSADALRQLTIDGHGVFLAPSFVIAEELATKAVVPLLPKYRPVEFAINAIYPHRNHLSTKVRCFIDLAAARFVERMAWMNPETPSKKGGSDKHY